jgi:H/ACA ribonucleoprotein complex subunit 3
MPSVVLNGRTIRLQVGDLIGKGGEADVYKIDKRTVLKLFKRVDDPDYIGDVSAQQGAELRIKEQQRKLPVFPKNLPVEVVAPTALVYNKTGTEVVGYTMPFVSDMEVLMRLGDRQYRETSGIDGNQVVTTFKELHRVFGEIHQAAVIGDVNDLNVLVNNTGLTIVDADSMQFGGFYCHTFTNRFVDPLLCEPDRLVLKKPHNENSDWYAYFTMLLQSLLFVGPYGGVHRPQTGKRLQHDARVLARLTILGSDVIYPKPALPLGVLPDELLGYIEQVYEKDLRGEFPLKYLENLRWTICTQCGATHARTICPVCATGTGYVKSVVTVRGTVTAERIFQTSGRLLYVINQGGKLRYLYHEAGGFYRENRREVLKGELDPKLRYRIQGSKTLIGQGETIFVLDGEGNQEPRLQTDIYRNALPVFDANGNHTFWVNGNQLVRDGRYGSEYVGDILPHQTLVWAGEDRGFGFFQAGKLVRAFLFETQGGGFNDQVEIPSLPGQLIDATCVFGKEYTWMFTTVQDQGAILHKCFVVDKQGKLIGDTTATDGEDSWLGGGIRGHLAVGASLYVSTDDGIVRIGIDAGQVFIEKEFPDTEPFVDSHTQLVMGQEGIYAITRNREITLLKIK